MIIKPISDFCQNNIKIKIYKVETLGHYHNEFWLSRLKQGIYYKEINSTKFSRPVIRILP